MTNEAVMAMVERELRAQPDISSGDLLAKVAKKHRSVRDLSTRQFHARYPLKVKKRWSLESGKKRRSTAKRKGSQAKRRSAVQDCTRDVLVKFADELLQMRDPSFTKVLSRVDHYAELLE